MIKFTDFIKDFTDGKESKIKCKFHMSTDFLGLEKSPYDCLMEDDIDWQNLNNYRNEKGKSSKLDRYDYLISFVQYNIYGRNFFVFGGIYEVKIANTNYYGIGGYDITLFQKFKEYRKRLVIKLTENLGINFELTYDQNVSLMYKDLKIALNVPAWIVALKNVKAIYVITDISNGNLYIGSACGNGGLFSRWSEYIYNLTGGNKEFEEIINKYGEDYIKKNFKYSILEIFDTKTKQEYILERENYWKNVFETKKFGMNWN